MLGTIARVEQHTTLYSEDEDIAKLVAPLELTVIPMHQLPLPPEDLQGSLELEPQGNE